MSPEHQQTTQELLKSLWLERKRIGEEMKVYPLDADQKEFAELFIQAHTLDFQIKDLLDSIESARSTRLIGQNTLSVAKDPDGRRITKKIIRRKK
jgi:hypothetical protein